MKLHYLLHPLSYVAIGALCLMPYAYLYVSIQDELQGVEALEREISTLSIKEVQAKEISQRAETLAKDLAVADHFYLDKHVETLSFLGQKKGVYPSDVLDNRLLFAEEKITKDDAFIEVEERQQHPVALNMEDLKHLLSSIEGVSVDSFTPKPGRPQLIIRDFHLKKAPISSEEEIFIVDMKLIKREKKPS